MSVFGIIFAVCFFGGIGLCFVSLYVGIAVIAIGLIAAIPSLIISKKLEKYCDGCYASLWGAGYEWTTIKANATNPNQQGEITYTIKYNLIYECPNCGKVKTEKVSQSSKNGYSDCEIKMNNYCVNRFGH